MKGLELSRRFYEQCVRQFLSDEFPEYSVRIAAGLVGEGSECYGFDDDISRDHDWGATICLWLTSQDYELIGSELMKKLYGLRDTFLGYPIQWIPGRNGVLEISSFFYKYLNKPDKLQTIAEWLTVPESNLSVAANGQIFSDPLREFSEIWEDLRMGYPEDIRLKKIAARCMQIAQAGQYNLPRSEQRGDVVAASLAEGEFIRSVISTVYLLNNCYTPFYKWMYHGMKKLPILGESISVNLEELLCTEQKGPAIETICGILIQEFLRQGISDTKEMFFVKQGESVHNHIRLEMLRKTDPWMDTIRGNRIQEV